MVEDETNSLLLLAMEGPEVRADCPVDIRLTLGGNLVAIVVANVPMRVRNFLNRPMIVAIG